MKESVKKLFRTFALINSTTYMEKSFKALLGTAILASFLFLPGQASAQKDSLKNEVSIGLESMIHGEICGGGLPRAAASTENKSAFVLGRTRLKVNFKRDGLEAYAALQNMAIWGAKGNQALNLYEGWVKLSSRHGFFAQAGRMALAYDDERIIGPNDFAAASLTHDVARLGYEGHGHKLHAILAWNQNGNNIYYGTYYDGGGQLYKTLQTLWYHYDVPGFPLGASLLFMNMGQQAGVDGKADNPARVEYQQMTGGYLKYHPKFFTLEGSYYRQTGQLVSEEKNSKPVDAWMASVKASVNPWERMGFVLGYDYLSGDDFIPVPYGGQFGLPRHAVEKGFTPLYGSRNQFYGLLDFFYESSYSHGFTPGLQNAFLGISGTPLPELSCSATYHYLAVATKLTDLSSTLGHCIDLQASWKVAKDIRFVAGYSLMVGTETMARLKQEGSGNQAHWGWFSLVVTPSIFQSRW